MKRYVIWGMLGALATFALLAARLGRRGGTADAAGLDSARIAVLGPSDVARAERDDLIAGVPVSGTLRPSVDIRIASPIPEVMDAVLVKEGEAVRRGQVLARFRTSAVAAAALSADAQRRKAAADYERMQNLFREGAVSRSDVETAEVTLRAAEATAAQAQKRLDEATVRAPVSGVISARHVEAGDRVKDGDALFQLVNTAELEFEATVPSEFALRVRPGQTVALAVTGLDDRSVSGRVARVNAVVDPATRQLKVYVSVANPDHRLAGGLFASGRVVQRQARQVLAVPRVAVRAAPDGSAYVLVVAGGAIARRAVTIGVVDEAMDLIEITSGLQVGDMVILGAATGLEPGQPVRVEERER